MTNLSNLTTETTVSALGSLIATRSPSSVLRAEMLLGFLGFYHSAERGIFIIPESTDKTPASSFRNKYYPGYERVAIMGIEAPDYRPGSLGYADLNNLIESSTHHDSALTLKLRLLPKEKKAGITANMKIDCGTLRAISVLERMGFECVSGLNYRENVSPDGVVAHTIGPRTAIAAAGMKEGDVICGAMCGTERGSIHSTSDLLSYLASHRKKPVSFVVRRGDKEVPIRAIKIP